MTKSEQIIYNCGQDLYSKLENKSSLTVEETEICEILDMNLENFYEIEDDADMVTECLCEVAEALERYNDLV